MVVNVNVKTEKNKRFIDRWAYVPGVVSCFILLCAVFSYAPAQTLLDKKVYLNEEAVNVGSFELQPSKLGALRIDVTSSFGNTSSDDDWIIYEIQLVDSQGNIIASAIDEDWKESGIWREDGETGTWRESNLTGGIELRSPQAEQLDLVIQLLERKYPDSSNSLSFQVKVQNRVLNSSALWIGFVLSVIIAIGAVINTKDSGREAIARKINDSDPQARANVGGKDNLVKVKLEVRLDKNTPRTVEVSLAINNAYGERVYHDVHSVSVFKYNSNGENRGMVHFKKFLILEPYSSYGFSVKVKPDDPVDWTYLEVRQGSKSLTSIDVINVSSD